MADEIDQDLKVLLTQTHGYIWITSKNRDQIFRLVDKGYLHIWPEGTVAYITNKGYDAIRSVCN